MYCSWQQGRKQVKAPRGKEQPCADAPGPLPRPLRNTSCLVSHLVRCDAAQFGMAPLHIACSFNRHAAAALLLASGAKIDVTTPEGETPLFAAAQAGRAEAVRVLLKAGASADAVNKVREAMPSPARGADRHARSQSAYSPSQNFGKRARCVCEYKAPVGNMRCMTSPPAAPWHGGGP